MYHYTHEDLELLYLMSDGMDGEDADPGAAQELRDLEAAGAHLPWAVPQQHLQQQQSRCSNTQLKDDHTLTHIRRNHNVQPV